MVVRLRMLSVVRVCKFRVRLVVLAIVMMFIVLVVVNRLRSLRMRIVLVRRRLGGGREGICCILLLIIAVRVWFRLRLVCAAGLRILMRLRLGLF